VLIDDAYFIAPEENFLESLGAGKSIVLQLFDFIVTNVQDPQFPGIPEGLRLYPINLLFLDYQVINVPIQRENIIGQDLVSQRPISHTIRAIPIGAIKHQILLIKATHHRGLLTINRPTNHETYQK
jgi:hypothetical protein